MATLDDDAKEYLSLVIKTSINEAMKPVHEQLVEGSLMLQKHNQSLYGTNGDNGINGDMKKIKEKVIEFDGYKKQVIAVAASVGMIVSVAGSYLKSKIIGG